MHMFPAIAHAAGVTTLFAALLVLPAAQSQAFHNSQLDSPTKQLLAGIIDRMQQLCDKGKVELCQTKEEVRAFGNALAEAEQDCAAGNQKGCQSRAVFREVVRSLKARLGTPLGELPRNSSPQAKPLPNQRGETPGPRPGSSDRPGGSRGMCHVFEIMIEGRVSSQYAQQPHRLTQLAILPDQGLRQHTFEFAIRYPGDLNGFDVQPGVIELMTNSAFARNAGMASASFDLGSTTSRGNTLAFQLDPGAALQMPQSNVFVGPGIAASDEGFGSFCVSPALKSLCEQFGRLPLLQTMYLVPGQGTLQLQLPTQQMIRGDINIVGFGLENSKLQARYQATFSGRLLKSEACP